GALAQTGQVESSVPDTPVTTSVPLWSGCPMGCSGYHEHGAVGIGRRCNFCTSLDWSARESLHDCSSVCPLAVAS
ncbi:MAG TPA: hypothetical protein VIQ02_20685, partial [Jiangellaceae bacterium]